MFNKNNNLIKFVFLFILTITIVFPSEIKAYVTNGAYVLYEDDFYRGDYRENIIIPMIYSLSPNSMSSSSNGANIIIYGKAFTPYTVAKWNGKDRPTTYISSTKLSMELNREDTRGNGKYLINVFNPENGGSFSNTNFFTLNNLQKQNENKRNESASSLITESAILNTSNNEIGINKNNLSANVSSSGIRFLPDTIIKWIFFFILILLSVHLWRKIYVTDKERNTPLKHA